MENLLAADAFKADSYLFNSLFCFLILLVSSCLLLCSFMYEFMYVECGGSKSSN